MAKDKPKGETRTEKHLAWLAAETARLEAAAVLKAAEEAADRTASELGDELRANGKNAVMGPGDVSYIVQANRKAKGSDEPPKYPLTLRKAQTLTY